MGRCVNSAPQTRRDETRIKEGKKGTETQATAGESKGGTVDSTDAAGATRES